VRAAELMLKENSAPGTNGSVTSRARKDDRLKTVVS
jgi:hypothetical protein